VRRALHIVGAWLVFSGALAACRPPRPSEEYKTAFATANQAQRERDLSKEETALATTAAACLPEDCPMIWLRYARVLAQAGKTSEALARIEQLAKDYPKSPEAPIALVDAAKLSDSTGANQGRDFLYRATRLDPASTGARRAIERLLARARAQGIPLEARTKASRAACGESPDCADPRGALAAREEAALLLATFSKSSELRYYTLDQVSRIEEELARPEKAIAIDEAIVKGGPGFGQYDDASYRLATRYLAAKEPAKAEARLKVLIDTRRESWGLGSYHSSYLDDATLLYGDIARDRGDAETARDRYRDLLKHFDDSILRDDALYHIATLETLAVQERCDALDELLQTQPESRFVDEAKALQQRLSCPPPSKR
jgi:predicted Zn-dependent protease